MRKENKLETDTIKSFGDEWSKFDQTALHDDEVLKIFNDYFHIFPWEKLPHNATGFDMGCGTGRWAKLVAKRVGHLHCIDPSTAIEIAKYTLVSNNNITYHCASYDNCKILKNSQDFGYSLGVLHHISNTGKALKECVELLKPGAPFLIYIYYAFDNRSWFYKKIWKFSDFIRKIIYKMPPFIKVYTTDLIAILIYYPLAKLSLVLEYLKIDINSIPLSYYRNRSFYTMRTDSRDRFGTPLEQRFTKKQIKKMMLDAGLSNIIFSNNKPYWCALGYKND